MIGILLLLAGVLFALLFVLIIVIRAVQGREKVGFFETLLAFLAVTLPLLALVNNNASEQPLALLNRAPLGIAVAVIVISFIVLLIELRKPGRKFNQRRGVFGIGIGALLVAATFVVPLASRLTAFPPMMGTQAFGSASTNSDGLVNIIDSARGSTENQPVSAMQILVEETGLESAQINARLSAGETIASIVNDTDGDLEQVIVGITDSAREQLETATAAGSIPQAQAGMMMDNLENIITQGINGELPQMIYDQLFTRLLSSEAAPAPLMPTNTPGSIALEVSPTPTRIPSATPTPTNTPYVLVSPTTGAITNESQPATAVRLSTCAALVENNLNLRDGASMDNQLLLTIPSSTTLNVSARNEASTWWLVQYEAQTGWVNGDYLTLGPGCADLPVRVE